MKGYINGNEVDFAPNETILTVARQSGHFIPTLCELMEINHAPATCRVCLVEILRPDETEPLMVTACNTPMETGMRVLTRTSRIREAQRLQIDLLLADHNQDCASCIRHGNCELQDVAQFVGLQNTRYNRHDLYAGRSRDFSSPAIIRDMTKCIRCFRCLKVCRDVQGTDILVIDDKGLGMEIGARDASTMMTSDCISCGQCTLVCPVGAISERDDTEQVIDYLYDPNVYTVFQFAPAIRIAIGEEFNLPAGSIVTGKIVTALKKLGADLVVDTNFTADLVVMEEGSELLKRVKEKQTLPLLTSCSPGWVNYIEKNYPDLLPHLSTAKSPQMCLGALAKTYLAEKLKVDPRRMRVVSIMPCTAKKEEAKRSDFNHNGQAEVDVVLTTREFARLLKREGIWLPNLEESHYDDPWMGEWSGAAALFGTTGGVTEAALRTVYYLIKGEELESVEIAPVRGTERIREAAIDFGGDIGTVRVAVGHGTKAAKILMDQLQAGQSPYTFIEIMGCPGGCMGGGGQPRNKKNYQTFWHARQKAIYEVDRSMPIRKAHLNPLIKKIYEEFLGEPLSHKSHEILHTHYHSRKREVKHTMKDIWQELKAKK